MRKIIICAVFFSTSALANNIPIEADHTISDTLTEKQVQAIAKMVKYYGYSCNSISSARNLILSDGWYIACNNYKYRYEIYDKGGKVEVKVK